MGQPQHTTPMQADNSTAEVISNNIINQKRTKAMGMQFYWLQDQIHQDITMFFGNQEQPICPAILLNIIHLTIIVAYAQYICTVIIIQIIQF